MSTCPKKDLYSAYVDGEVPSPWKEKLDAHLEICLKCQKIVASYRSLKQKVQETKVPKLDLNEAFARLEKRKLSQEIRKEESEERPNWFNRTVKIPIPAVAAAAVFLLVFTPIFVNTTQRANQKPQIIVSNFKPIMPVSSELEEKEIKDINFNELNALGLNIINDIEKENKRKINFSRVINFYLPRKNTETDLLVINQFLDNSDFFQDNLQALSVNYDNNGK